MKTLKFSLLTLAFVLVAFVNGYSQTLDEIISKNTEAMGGMDKIKSLTSIYLENSFMAMDNESTSTSVVLNGKGAKTKTDFNGQSMIQCYTDKGGWAINPMSGSSDATAMPQEQYNMGKNQIYIGQTFMDYAAKGNKVELLGKEKLENNDVFKIKVTSSDNNTTVYYINATSYFVVQSTMSAEMMGQKMDVVTKYSDYQKTDFGYVIPRTTAVSYGDQFSMTMKVKKVEINKPVDPTIFDLGNTK